MLGVNGTLGAWSTAIITNNTNTVEAVDSVALQETSATAPGGTCTTVSGSDNTVTCAIDAYGGAEGSPLDPDGVNSNSETLTFENVGTGPGDLTLEAESCSNSGGAPTATNDICDVVTVEITCASANAYGPGALSAFFTATDGSPVTIANLDSGDTVSCDVVVTLPTTAPADVAGQTGTQSIVWTLS
ncbi:hypothetical protein [Nocardioides sp. YIM 152588]|uniref:hypothetical protein n=1 Tax=Nocardioides sp. YIM 152588 TaxID=3158259 RepID=UPI0032E37BB6